MRVVLVALLVAGLVVDVSACGSADESAPAAAELILSSITEWQVSWEQTRRCDPAVDAQGRVWFVETAPDPNRFAGFDIATEQFIDAAYPESGGSTIRHMINHAETGSLWFGADTNTIGRAVVH